MRGAIAQPFAGAFLIVSWSVFEDWTELEARAKRLAEAFLRPPRPRMADVLEVVTGIHRSTIDEAMSARRWHIGFDSHRSTLEWVVFAGGRWTTKVVTEKQQCVTDPREAWELLSSRGVIPDDWVGTNARRFARGLRAATPPTMGGVVAIASDPEGVLEAERLAREVAGRLNEWGVGRAPRVVWHVDDALRWVTSGSVNERAGRVELALPGGEVMHELLSAIGYTVPSVSSGPRWGPRRRGALLQPVELSGDAELFLEYVGDRNALPIANLLDAHQAWRAACAADRELTITVPERETGQWVVRNELVRNLPDPFEPLFMLLERGYLLLEVTKRSVQLYASTDGTSGRTTAPRL
jgi:hypothetical protein